MKSIPLCTMIFRLADGAAIVLAFGRTWVMAIDAWNEEDMRLKRRRDDRKEDTAEGCGGSTDGS